jgi:beta-galactosidase GanA
MYGKVKDGDLKINIPDDLKRKYANSFKLEYNKAEILVDFADTNENQDHDLDVVSMVKFSPEMAENFVLSLVELIMEYNNEFDENLLNLNSSDNE